MYQHQISERQQFAYPPYTRIMQFKLMHTDAKFTKEAAVYFAGLLRERFGKRILGPEEADDSEDSREIHSPDIFENGRDAIPQTIEKSCVGMHRLTRRTRKLSKGQISDRRRSPIGYPPHHQSPRLAELISISQLILQKNATTRQMAQGASIERYASVTGWVNSARRACNPILASGLERLAPYFRSPLMMHPMCASWARIWWCLPVSSFTSSR